LAVQFMPAISELLALHTLPDPETTADPVTVDPAPLLPTVLDVPHNTAHAVVPVSVVPTEFVLPQHTVLLTALVNVPVEPAAIELPVDVPLIEFVSPHTTAELDALVMFAVPVMIAPELVTTWLLVPERMALSPPVIRLELASEEPPPAQTIDLDPLTELNWPVITTE
jgi:hypothetical protein